MRLHTAEGHVIGDIAAGEGYVVDIIAAQLPGAGNGIDHNPIQRVGENAVFQRPCAGQRRPFAVGQNRRRIEVLVRRAVVIPEFQIVAQGHAAQRGPGLHLQRPNGLFLQFPQRRGRNGPCGTVVEGFAALGKQGVSAGIHRVGHTPDAAALRVRLHTAEGHVIGDIAAGEGYVVDIIAAQLPGAGNGIDHNPIQRVGENAVFQRPCAGQRRPFAVGQNRRRIEVLVRRAVVIPEFQIVAQGHAAQRGPGLHLQRPNGLFLQFPQRRGRNGPCGTVVEGFAALGKQGVSAGIHRVGHTPDAAALRVRLHTAEGHVIGDIAAGEGYVVDIIAAQLPGAGNGIDHNPIQRVGENAVFQRPCAGQRRPFAVGQNRRRIEVLVRRAVVIPEFQIVTEGHVPRSGANLHVQRPEVLIGQRPKRGSRNGPCGAVIALRPSFGEKGVVPDIHDGIRPGDAAALRIGLRAADAHVILRQ